MRHVRALMLGIALIALVVACGGYAVLRELRTPAGTSSQPIEVVVEQGDSTARIATKLRAANLIRQPTVFAALVRTRGLEGKLQSGRYMLRSTMTMSQILSALQNSRVAEASVTIPEGWRLEEIAARFAETGVVREADFLTVAKNGAAFKSTYFMLSDLPEGASLEGYLFPDTYRISATSTVTDIVDLMLSRFNQQYATLERDVRVPNRSVREIVTLASIVQREAVHTDEMPRIAAVFWNRLKPEHQAETGNGKLQADPTVQYALGFSDQEKTWWRKELTTTDLQNSSAYNTYTQAGLPPGPISNPGLDALTAAAQPDDSATYLYFVASCAKDGTHNFAASFPEFQRFEAEYRACQ